MSWRSASFIAASVLSAMLVGCGRSPYELAPVRGTVTVDGERLASGRVMFAPISRGDSPKAGKPAFGTLQPDGSYVLTTYQDGDGAIVGEHWITIFGPKAAAQPASQAGRSIAHLPAFYRFVVREKQSVISGQDNQIDIRLTAQEVARFASSQ